MAGENRVLTDHDEIRRWVEQRGGTPATVEGTPGGGEAAGILRIDFPGYSGQEKLRPISWEEFFAKFEESRLALVVQEETAGGAKSNFNKFVARESV